MEQLDRAIGFHRAMLATSIDDHFMTPEQLQMSPPPEPAPQGARAGEFVITRASCTFEVPAEERAPILADVRWPLAGIITLQEEHIRHILAPGIYILPSPLTDAERSALRTRQETQLREFDECVTKTRPVLLHLAQDGADPLFLLSVLVRYMPIRGTEAPRGQSISLQSHEFDVTLLGDRSASPLAPLADWDAGRIDKLALRLEGAKRIPPQPHTPRRSGPAEAAPSLGMALLADHLATTTSHGRSHARDLAELVRVWVPWMRDVAYFTGKHVYNRVRRVKASKEFRRVAQEEEIRHRAEAVLYAARFPTR